MKTKTAKTAATKKTAPTAEPELGNAQGITINGSVEVIAGPTAPEIEAAAPAAEKQAVAPKAKRTPKVAEPKAPRVTKKQTVVGLIQRTGGATRTELMAATGWNARFVDGFVAWTVIKKLALPVVSTKGENGERTFAIA